jgi:hypothetical protein
MIAWRWEVTIANQQAEIERLRGLLVECRAWLGDPADDCGDPECPDCSALRLAERITAALDTNAPANRLTVPTLYENSHNSSTTDQENVALSALDTTRDAHG